MCFGCTLSVSEMIIEATCFMFWSNFVLLFILCPHTHSLSCFPLPLPPSQLLRVDYPSLLESQRCVEVCVALSSQEAEAAADTSDLSDLELSAGPPTPIVFSVSDANPSSNSKAASCLPPVIPPTTDEEKTNSLTKNDSCQSWEVLSRQSTTSTLLTMRQDEAAPGNQLIPLWECLQVCQHLPDVSCKLLLLSLSLSAGVLQDTSCAGCLSQS